MGEARSGTPPISAHPDQSTGCARADIRIYPYFARAFDTPAFEA